MTAAIRPGPGKAGADAVARVAGRWLHLAAAPTFAAMALLTAISGSGSPAVLCGGSGSLGGMATMYLLMSAFHLSPWLEVLFRRRGEPRRG